MNDPRPLFLAAFALFFLLGSIAPAQTITGNVVRVSDGDTIVVRDVDKIEHKIRLYGIDCPESKQAYGNDATEFVFNFVATEKVACEVLDVDRYKRLVCVVTLPSGKILQEEILKAGYAWVYKKYCKAEFCLDWYQLEKQARDKKSGLWQDGTPVPPWEWRKR